MAGSADRALSEEAGAGILIGITLLVLLATGLNVIVLSEEESGPETANFTYNFVSESATMTVTYSDGPPLAAGKVVFKSPSSRATWAQLANTSRTTEIAPGDLVLLATENAWGEPVSARTSVEVLYSSSGNETKIDEWNGAEQASLALAQPVSRAKEPAGSAPLPPPAATTP